jgi:hypothetical protein
MKREGQPNKGRRRLRKFTNVRFGSLADIGCLFDYLISDLLDTQR